MVQACARLSTMPWIANRYTSVPPPRSQGQGGFYGAGGARVKGAPAHRPEALAQVLVPSHLLVGDFAVRVCGSIGLLLKTFKRMVPGNLSQVQDIRKLEEIMVTVEVLEEQLQTSMSQHGSSINEQSIELKV